MMEACKILRTSAFLKDWMVNVNLSCCVTWLIAFCLSDGNLSWLILMTCPKYFRCLCWILWIIPIFHSLFLFVTPSILHRHALSLVCWWWFYWTFARLISSVVTTTSIRLGSSKMRNRDVLVPAYRVCSRNWPVEWMLSSCFLSVFVYCSTTERSFSGQSTADLVYVLKSSLPSVIMSLKMTYVNIEFNGIIILFLTWFVCFQLTTYRYWV